MAGPALFFACTPVSVKMPVPITMPIPKPIRSQADSRLLSRVWWASPPTGSSFCRMTSSTSFVRVRLDDMRARIPR